MLLVGTSGWQYDSWRGPFYSGVAQRRWYEHVLSVFRTVELNVSFYRLPRREVFEGWARRAPADAIVTVKASRYLTHIKRLRDPQPSVQMLMDRASGLGPRLGPVLVQLPPDLGVDVDALAATLGAFPAGTRLAVEPRHPSWWSEPVRAVLAEHGAALVWADRKETALGPLWRTADWGYLRLHEGVADPPFYRQQTLEAWVRRLAETFGPDEDVFVYFNNDPRCAAVHDALHFAHAARAAGVPVSRVDVEHPQVDYACSASTSTRLPNGSSV